MTILRNILDLIGGRIALLGSLVALNAPFVLALLMRNLRGMSAEPITVFYTGGALLGWYLAPPLFVAVILAVLLAPWRRTALGVLGLLLTLYAYFILIDGFVFAVYKFHVDFFWIDFVIHDFEGLGIPMHMAWTAAIGLAVAAALQVGLIVLATKLPRPGRVAGWFAGAVVVAMASSQIMHAAAYEIEDARITGVTHRLPFYLPMTSHDNAMKYGHLLPMIRKTGGGGDEELLAGAAGRGGALHYPQRPIERTEDPGRRPPNIVWIMLESWRADTMNHDVSPRMAGLADSSTVCLEHFSTGNSTVAGVFGMFYGLYPTYWDAVKSDAARIDNPVLIDVLKEEGYEFGVYARSHFGRHKIQDTVFRGIPIVEDFEGKTTEHWDRDLTDRALAFIDRRADGDRPFFLMAFYKASHFDYRYDEAHMKFKPATKLSKGLIGGRRENPELYKNDYRNAVYFDDDEVGRVLDRLQERGLMDETVIVITTDHSEQFDDDGADYWGHGSNFTRWQLQVPLILYRPGGGARRIEEPTSHMDLPPTLLQEFFGVTNDPRDYSDGVNLFADVPPLRPLVVSSYFNHAFVVGNDVYAVEPTGMKKHTLDDINAPAASPSMATLRRIMDDLSRFHERPADAQN